MRILVFGDSISLGCWDTEGGWVDRLKRAVHKRYVVDGVKCQLYNLGTGAEASAGLLARIENEIESRRSKSWPFVFIIATGINDSRDVDEIGNNQATKEIFEKNLIEIISICKKHSNKILLVGLTPVAPEELQFKNLFYSNNKICDYDGVITKVSQAYSVPMVSLLSSFENHPEFLFKDGLHPNDAGHELIAKLVKPELDKLIAS